MTKTIVGFYERFGDADRAVQELNRNGFHREQISVVTRRLADHPATLGAPPEEAGEATSAGAAAGAAVGGAAGLIGSLAALSIPVIGPILAAGPLIATLAGAGMGAIAGGLIGALTEAGIPEQEAILYEAALRRGGTLVAVISPDALAERVAEILTRNGAVDIHRRAADWPEVQPPASSPGRPPGESPSARKDEAQRVGRSHKGERDYELYDADFRANHTQAYASTGMTYEEFAPAYRLGYDLASDPQLSDKDWSAVESEARRQWEQRSPGTWERFKDAIRYSWDRVKQQVM